MKTEQELRQLAVDIKSGAVFTTNHMPTSDEHMIGSIFMPLMLMNEEQHKDFIDKKPGMVYEYLEKAMPRSVNGYPTFMSFEFLTEEELTIANKFYLELTAWEKGTTPEQLECQALIGADDVCGLPPDSPIHTTSPQRHDFVVATRLPLRQ